MIVFITARFAWFICQAGSRFPNWLRLSSWSEIFCLTLLLRSLGVGVYLFFLLNFINFFLEAWSFILADCRLSCFVLYGLQKALTTSSSFWIHSLITQRWRLGLFFTELLNCSTRWQHKLRFKICERFKFWN